MLRKKKRALKVIAFLLAFKITLADVLHAAPVEALSLGSTPSALQTILDDPQKFEAPLDHSLLKEVHKGRNGTFIIHIQDAHANLSGQQNLAGALDELMAKYDISLVLVEGGTRDDSLTPLKKLAKPDEWKRIAKRFLMEGTLTGEEYLNLTSDHPMKIMGIEDKELYRESILAYAELAGRREEVLIKHKKATAAVEALKMRMYPRELLDYEKMGEGGGQQAEKGLGERLKKLLELAGERDALTAYPQIRSLARLLERESSIDFDLANLEQAALVEKLSKNGGRSLKAALGQLSKIKDQRLSQLNFVRTLLREANDRNVLTGDHPNLLAYERYLDDFEDIDLERFFDERQMLEDEVYRLRLSSDEARLVRAIDRYLGLLDLAYRIQMSTADFRMFTVNEPDLATRSYLAFLNRQLAEQGSFEGLVPESPAFEEAKTALKAFYASVSRRDEAFIRNTERILSSEKERIAVLISGGYHSDHLKELFKEKGFSYAVLSPLVTSETDLKKYERILLEPVLDRKATVTSDPDRIRTKKSLLEEDLLMLKRKTDGARQEALAENGARLARVLEALPESPERAAAALELMRGARLAAPDEKKIITSGGYVLIAEWEHADQRSDREINELLARTKRHLQLSMVTSDERRRIHAERARGLSRALGTRLESTETFTTGDIKLFRRWQGLAAEDVRRMQEGGAKTDLRSRLLEIRAELTLKNALLSTSEGARLSSQDPDLVSAEDPSFRRPAVLVRTWEKAAGLLRTPGMMYAAISAATTVVMAFTGIAGWHQLWEMNENSVLVAAVLSALSPLFIFRAFTSYIGFFWSNILESRQEEPEPYRIDDPDLPMVTVQIPIRKEPFEVVRMTLDSALAIDYPRDRIEIQVIDNSDLPEQYERIRAYTENAGAQFIHRDGTQGFKAGNLNLGLERAKGEFFLILDADSTVRPDVLLRSLPEFRDEKLGYTQFYVRTTNGDVNALTRILDMGGINHNRQLKMRNRQGFISFDGHNGVVRRAALEAAGRWQEAVSEDLLTAIKMRLAGYQGKFLSYIETGEWAPTTFQELKKQRRKWATGTSDALLRVAFDVVRTPHLAWYEKVDLMYRMTYSLMAAVGYLMAFFYIEFPAFVVAGILALSYGSVLFSYVKSERREPPSFYIKGLFAFSSVIPDVVFGMLRQIFGAALTFSVTSKTKVESTGRVAAILNNRLSMMMSVLYFSGTLFVAGESYLTFILATLPATIGMVGALINPLMMPGMEATADPEDRAPSSGFEARVYEPEGFSGLLEWPSEPVLRQDLSEHVSEVSALQIRRVIMQRRESLRLSLVVPTFDSAAYLRASLEHLYGEMQTASERHPGWSFDLIVSLNGASTGDARQVVREFQETAGSERIRIVLIDMEGIQGKVQAMNAGAFYARSMGADILGFVDDDIRYRSGTLDGIVSHLLDDERLYLVGPQGGPARSETAPSDPFQRLEEEASNDSMLPMGSGQYMLAAFYPYIPADIIADDSYLVLYFMKEGEPLARIGLAPDTQAQWRLTGHMRAYLKRYIRTSMAVRQLRDIFSSGTKFDNLMGVFHARAFRQRTTLSDLLRGLGLVDRLRMAAVIGAVAFSRAAIGQWTEFKVRVKRSMGEPAYGTRWYEAPTTKSFDRESDTPATISGARLSAERGPPTKGSFWNARMGLAAVLAGTLAVRSFGLGYNGPMIDEAFYSVAKDIGNVPFLTGDSRLWPVVSYVAHAFGGLWAARTVTAVFGTLTVAAVYQIAKYFGGILAAGRERSVAVFAALFFSLSSPALFVSKIATYDAMAFMFYAAGFWLMTRGIGSRTYGMLLLSAVSLSIAAATRHFVVGLLPLAVLWSWSADDETKDRSSQGLLYGSFVAVIVGLYALPNYEHLTRSIENARNLGRAISAGQTHWDVAMRLLEKGAPILSFGAAEIASRFKGRQWKGEGSGQIKATLFLAAAALLVPAYHLWNGNSYTLEKNFVGSLMFGSVLAGLYADRVRQWFEDRWQPNMVRAALGMVLTGTLLAGAMPDLRREQSTWADWRPLVSELKDERAFASGAIWSTASSGWDGNVWFLRREFGDRVDVDSPWKAGSHLQVLRMAAQEKVRWVVGPLSGEALSEGDVIAGYDVRRVFVMERGPVIYLFELSKASGARLAFKNPEGKGLSPESAVMFSYPHDPASELPATMARLSAGSDIYRQALDEVSSGSGISRGRLMVGGPLQKGMSSLETYTRLSLAGMAHSIGLYRMLVHARAEYSPFAFASISGGIFAALVLSEAIRAETMAKWMTDRWVSSADRSPEYGMYFVRKIPEGIDSSALEDILEKGRVEIVQDASPERIVLAVSPAVDREEMSRLIRQRFLTDEVRLFENPPMQISHTSFTHTLEMERRLRDLSEAMDVRAPRIPVLSSSYAQPSILESADQVRDELANLIFRPIFWTQTIRYLQRNNVRRFIEMGTGDRLTQFQRQIAPESEVITVNDAHSLRSATERMGARLAERSVGRREFLSTLAKTLAAGAAMVGTYSKLNPELLRQDEMEFVDLGGGLQGYGQVTEDTMAVADRTDLIKTNPVLFRQCVMVIAETASGIAVAHFSPWRESRLQQLKTADEVGEVFDRFWSALRLRGMADGRTRFFTVAVGDRIELESGAELNAELLTRLKRQGIQTVHSSELEGFTDLAFDVSARTGELVVDGYDMDGLGRFVSQPLMRLTSTAEGWAQGDPGSFAHPIRKIILPLLAAVAVPLAASAAVGAWSRVWAHPGVRIKIVSRDPKDQKDDSGARLAIDRIEPSAGIPYELPRRPDEADKSRMRPGAPTALEGDTVSISSRARALSEQAQALGGVDASRILSLELPIDGAVFTERLRSFIGLMKAGDIRHLMVLDGLTNDGFGDQLVRMSLVRSLMSKNPDMAVTIVGGRSWRFNPRRIRLLSGEKVLSDPAAIADLLRQAPDLIVATSGIVDTALLAPSTLLIEMPGNSRFAESRTVIKDGKRAELSIERREPYVMGNVYQLDREISEALFGVEDIGKISDWLIDPLSEEFRIASEWLSERGFGPNQPHAPVVVASLFGGAFEDKGMPLERMVELVVKLRRAGYLVLVTRNRRSSDDFMQRFRASIGDLDGIEELPSTEERPALYQYFIHLTDGGVAVDGGPMHLMHALGKPLVGVFSTRWMDGRRRGRASNWFPWDADLSSEALVMIPNGFDSMTGDQADRIVAELARVLPVDSNVRSGARLSERVPSVLLAIRKVRHLLEARRGNAPGEPALILIDGGPGKSTLARAIDSEASSGKGEAFRIYGSALKDLGMKLDRRAYVISGDAMQSFYQTIALARTDEELPFAENSALKPEYRIMADRVDRIRSSDRMNFSSFMPELLAEIYRSPGIFRPEDRDKIVVWDEAASGQYLSRGLANANEETLRALGSLLVVRLKLLSGPRADLSERSRPRIPVEIELFELDQVSGARLSDSIQDDAIPEDEADLLRGQMAAIVDRTAPHAKFVTRQEYFELSRLYYDRSRASIRSAGQRMHSFQAAKIRELTAPSQRRWLEWTGGRHKPENLPLEARVLINYLVRHRTDLFWLEHAVDKDVLTRFIQGHTENGSIRPASVEQFKKMVAKVRLSAGLKGMPIRVQLSTYLDGIDVDRAVTDALAAANYQPIWTAQEAVAELREYFRSHPGKTVYAQDPLTGSLLELSTLYAAREVIEVMSSRGIRSFVLDLGEEGGTVSPAGARLADDVRAYRFLTSKFGLRFLAMGGPILQPDRIHPLKVSEETRQILAERYGPERVLDLGFDRSIDKDAMALSIEDVAQKILSGELALPLVYKPNLDANGSRSIFIERSGTGRWSLTMAHSSTGAYVVNQKYLELREILREYPEVFAMVDEDRDLLQISIDAGTTRFAEILGRIHSTISTIENRDAQFAEVDPGIVETVMPLIRFRGRAYETRHAFEGDGARGVTEFLRIQKGTLEGWFGRVGSSSYYSNYTGRESAVIYPASKMYEPLYASTSLPVERRSAFEEHVEDLIRQEVSHLLERLRSKGFELTNFKGQIDLGWLPADESSNGFPRPLIIEARFEPAGTVEGARLAQNGNGKAKERSRLMEKVRSEFRAIAEITERWREAPFVVANFGSARIPEAHFYYQEQKEFGALMWDEGMVPLTGAGPSMMKGVQEAFVQKRNSLGIPPTNANSPQGVLILGLTKESQNEFSESWVAMDHFITRKFAFQGADGAVIWPGGFGTFDELFEFWRRGVPLVFYGKEYWGPILSAFEESLRRAGIHSQLRSRRPYLLTNSKAEAIEYLKRQRQMRAKYPVTRERLSAIESELERVLSPDVPGSTGVLDMRRAVTFTGRPKPSAAELKEAVDVARRLARPREADREPVPIRIASRGPLLNALLTAARREGWDDQVQLVLFVPEGRPLTIHEKDFRRAHPEAFLITGDESIHQLAITANAHAYVFLPGGVGTMNKLFDILTVIQTGKVRKKSIFMMDGGHFEPFFKAVKKQTLQSEPGEWSFNGLTIEKISLVSPGDTELVSRVSDASKMMDEMARLLAVEGVWPSGARLAGSRASERYLISRRDLLKASLAVAAGGVVGTAIAANVTLTTLSEPDENARFSPERYDFAILPTDDPRLKDGRAIYVSTINAYGRSGLNKVPLGLLVRDGVEVSPLYTNERGRAMQRGVGAFDAQSRLTIQPVESFKQDETMRHIFQSGPIAVTTDPETGRGVINENIFEWYRGILHGRARVLGVDGLGDLHVLSLYGLNIAGIKSGLMKGDFAMRMRLWHEQNDIRSAIFVDGGSAGVSDLDWQKPPYVLAALPRSGARLSSFDELSQPTFLARHNAADLAARYARNREEIGQDGLSSDLAYLELAYRKAKAYYFDRGTIREDLMREAVRAALFLLEWNADVQDVAAALFYPAYKAEAAALLKKGGSVGSLEERFAVLIGKRDPNLPADAYTKRSVARMETLRALDLQEFTGPIQDSRTIPGDMNMLTAQMNDYGGQLFFSAIRLAELVEYAAVSGDLRRRGKGAFSDDRVALLMTVYATMADRRGFGDVSSTIKNKVYQLIYPEDYFRIISEKVRLLALPADQDILERLEVRRRAGEDLAILNEDLHDLSLMVDALLGQTLQEMGMEMRDFARSAEMSVEILHRVKSDAGVFEKVHPDLRDHRKYSYVKELPDLAGFIVQLNRSRLYEFADWISHVWPRSEVAQWPVEFIKAEVKEGDEIHIDLHGLFSDDQADPLPVEVNLMTFSRYHDYRYGGVSQKGAWNWILQHFSYGLERIWALFTTMGVKPVFRPVPMISKNREIDFTAQLHKNDGRIAPQVYLLESSDEAGKTSYSISQRRRIELPSQATVLDLAIALGRVPGDLYVLKGKISSFLSGEITVEQASSRRGIEPTDQFVMIKREKGQSLDEWIKSNPSSADVRSVAGALYLSDLRSKDWRRHLHVLNQDRLKGERLIGDLEMDVLMTRDLDGEYKPILERIRPSEFPERLGSFAKDMGLPGANDLMRAIGRGIVGKERFAREFTRFLSTNEQALPSMSLVDEAADAQGARLSAAPEEYERIRDVLEEFLASGGQMPVPSALQSGSLDDPIASAFILDPGRYDADIRVTDPLRIWRANSLSEIYAAVWTKARQATWGKDAEGRDRFSPAERDLVLRAAVLAFLAHQLFNLTDEGRYRRFGGGSVPYIVHPTDVLMSLSGEFALLEGEGKPRIDAATLAAAILHDVIEDTRLGLMKEADLVRLLAPEGSGMEDAAQKTWRLVRALSKTDGEAETDYLNRITRSFDTEFDGDRDSYFSAILIKLTDRLSNIRHNLDLVADDELDQELVGALIKDYRDRLYFLKHFVQFTYRTGYGFMQEAARHWNEQFVRVYDDQFRRIVKNDALGAIYAESIYSALEPSFITRLDGDAHRVWSGLGVKGSETFIVEPVDARDQDSYDQYWDILRPSFPPVVRKGRPGFDKDDLSRALQEEGSPLKAFALKVREAGGAGRIVGGYLYNSYFGSIDSLFVAEDHRGMGGTHVLLDHLRSTFLAQQDRVGLYALVTALDEPGLDRESGYHRIPKEKLEQHLNVGPTVLVTPSEFIERSESFVPGLRFRMSEEDKEVLTKLFLQEDFVSAIRLTAEAHYSRTTKSAIRLMADQDWREPRDLSPYEIIGEVGEGENHSIVYGRPNAAYLMTFKFGETGGKRVHKWPVVVKWVDESEVRGSDSERYASEAVRMYERSGEFEGLARIYGQWSVQSASDVIHVILEEYAFQKGWRVSDRIHHMTPDHRDALAASVAENFTRIFLRAGLFYDRIDPREIRFAHQGRIGYKVKYVGHGPLGSPDAPTFLARLLREDLFKDASAASVLEGVRRGLQAEIDDPDHFKREGETDRVRALHAELGHMGPSGARLSSQTTVLETVRFSMAEIENLLQIAEPKTMKAKGEAIAIIRDKIRPQIRLLADRARVLAEDQPGFEDASFEFRSLLGDILPYSVENAIDAFLRLRDDDPEADPMILTVSMLENDESISIRIIANGTGLDRSETTEQKQRKGPMRLGGLGLGKSPARQSPIRRLDAQETLLDRRRELGDMDGSIYQLTVPKRAIYNLFRNQGRINESIMGARQSERGDRLRSWVEREKAITLANLSSGAAIDRLPRKAAGGFILPDARSWLESRNDYARLLSALEEVLAEAATSFSVFSDEDRQDIPGSAVTVLGEAVANAKVHGNREEPGRSVAVTWRLSDEGIEIRVYDEAVGSADTDFSPPDLTPAQSVTEVRSAANQAELDAILAKFGGIMDHGQGAGISQVLPTYGFTYEVRAVVEEGRRIGTEFIMRRDRSSGARLASLTPDEALIREKTIALLVRMRDWLWDGNPKGPLWANTRQNNRIRQIRNDIQAWAHSGAFPADSQKAHRGIIALIAFAKHERFAPEAVRQYLPKLRELNDLMNKNLQRLPTPSATNRPAALTETEVRPEPRSSTREPAEKTPQQLGLFDDDPSGARLASSGVRTDESRFMNYYGVSLPPATAILSAPEGMLMLTPVMQWGLVSSPVWREVGAVVPLTVDGRVMILRERDLVSFDRDALKQTAVSERLMNVLPSGARMASAGEKEITDLLAQDERTIRVFDRAITQLGITTESLEGVVGIDVSRFGAADESGQVKPDELFFQNAQAFALAIEQDQARYPGIQFHFMGDADLVRAALENGLDPFEAGSDVWDASFAKRIQISGADSLKEGIGYILLDHVSENAVQPARRLVRYAAYLLALRQSPEPEALQVPETVIAAVTQMAGNPTQSRLRGKDVVQFALGRTSPEVLSVARTFMVRAVRLIEATLREYLTSMRAVGQAA